MPNETIMLEREQRRSAHCASPGLLIELTEEEARRHVHIQERSRSSAVPHYTSSLQNTPLREPISLLSSCGVDDSNSGEEKIIDLRGFAYLDAQLPIKSTSMALPETASLDPKSKGKRRDMDLFVDGLSEKHLAKLTKCVSCNIPWTMRKGAIQKMKHVRSCARKKCFNSETIRAAVLKEVENTAIKATKKVQTSQSPEVTLLENSVDSLTTGKKLRRRAQETVKSVTVTRDAILYHAKEILACSAQTEKMDVQDGNPSTQQFGQSVLKQGFKAELFAEASMDKLEYQADQAHSASINENPTKSLQ